MKKFNILVALALASTALVSCEDLDTKYQGGYVTTEQKGAALQANPLMAAAGVNGISSIASSFMTVYDNHFDFGYPGVMIGLDLQGVDVVCENSGYNWYTYWEAFTSPSPSGTPAGMAWYHLYKQILTCNTVTASIQNPESKELKFYRAQALATRAFDYFTLAQLFQFNYSINPDAPCVPLVTDENAAEIEANGAPRASVQEVYDQILSDINEAITLLDESGLDPSDMLDTKPKRMVSLATAYGLRARINLVMHNYAAAAADATSAIAAFDGSPLTIDECNRPGFTDIDNHSWMWGIAIAETDRVVTSGIVNFPSMTCTFCSNGYVAVGAWKYINSTLYDAIPASDVRKGWFLDENCQSAMLNKQEQAYIDSYGEDMFPYTQVKYAGYQNVVGQSTNASDIPLMRIEEMYYIQAEATAMSGNAAGGREMITNFVRTYRNPDYRPTGTTPEEVQETIYQDRRVEFFLEGISWFDIMRLNKNVDRRGANWPSAFVLNIPSYTNDTSADKSLSSVLIYCIPQGEINGNPALSEADNNPTGSRPSPVAN